MSGETRELLGSIIWIAGYIASFYLIARVVAIRWPPKKTVRFGPYRRIPMFTVPLLIVWWFVYPYLVRLLTRLFV
jgi:hypothetical protein